MIPRILFLSLLFLLASPSVADVENGPWVITTDYGVFGGIEALSGNGPWTSTGELSAIPGDAVARWHGGLVYVVGRGGANLIQIYDPAGGWSLVREFSVGSGRNPQDIAFDTDGQAWVACYDDPVLLKLDPATGSILQTFDTSAYADGDGLPETAWLLMSGGRLYITCQKLDRNNWYTPTGPGQILVMDVAQGQWLDPIDLESLNPYTRIREAADGDLLVGCAGYWAVSDGGIERVDPDTGQSEGLVLDEGQLGGDVLNFVPTAEGELFAITSNSSFVTSLKMAQFPGGNVTTLATSAGYDLVDVAWDGSSLLMVADRDLAAPGIRVFDSASGAELTDGPVATELPPFMTLFRGQGLSGVPGGAVVGSLRLEAPFPNPCNPAAELVIRDEPGRQVRVSVFDMRGRKVTGASMVCGFEGRAVYRFTGVTGRGRSLPAGVYRVAAQSPGGWAARTLTLVK